LSLNISYNDLTSQGGIFISDALCTNTTLIQLDIAGNPLGDAAGMKFAAMLQVNVNLHTMSFKSCDFGARSLVALASVLNFSNVIRQLDLSDNVTHFNSLTQSLQTDIVNHLSKAIQISNSLKELNISKMAITDWNMLDCLAYAIRYCMSLEVLDLSR
jgi:Ran GTPase-activating protein (RanGAP) involved in mRNA processing and transport